MESVIIGYHPSFVGHSILESLKTCLSENQISFELKTISNSFSKAFEEDGLDMIISPINEISFRNENEEIVIAGFLKRAKLNYHMHLKERDQNILGLKKDGNIALENSASRQQIEYIRSDANIVPNLKKEEAFENPNVDGFIGLSKSDNWPFVLTIPTADITPQASVETYCFITKRSSFEIRSLVQGIHDADTGYCSNIERTIARDLGLEKDKLAVHCAKDRAGRFNLNLAVLKSNGEIKRINISQTTFVGLVDNALKELNS